jgi:hypothetical protein
LQEFGRIRPAWRRIQRIHALREYHADVSHRTEAGSIAAHDFYIIFTHPGKNNLFRRANLFVLEHSRRNVEVELAPARRTVFDEKQLFPY